MMINAFFDNTILKIYVNGNFSFSNDYYEYPNRQVQVNGNTVTAYLQTSCGGRMTTVFEYNENGNLVNIRQMNF